MNVFKVLTAIHGLSRAGDLTAQERRQPIAPGEIVALPDILVTSLLAALAIEPSDEPVTCELDWDKPEPEAVKRPAGIDPADKAALVKACEALGAKVIHLGANMAELAAALSNSELVKELVARLDSGHLPHWELPEQLQPKAAQPEQAADTAGDPASPEAPPSDNKPEAAKAAEAQPDAAKPPQGKGKGKGRAKAG